MCAMSNGSFGDVARDQLRVGVAAVERAVARLPASGDGTAPTDAVREAWTALVHQLALGPARATRTCPACGGIGMQAATRCLHCWGKLVADPVAAAAGGAP
jgi:hypothetical protein